MSTTTDRRSRPEPSVPGLHALAPEPLPFAPSLEIRAFLLDRPRGNILLYSTKGLAAERPVTEALGGISRRYLNHRHEAIFAAEGIDAPLFVHERERRSVERTDHVRATFSRRHHLDEDFEVIPTPGHTSGATAYLWDSGKHRMLFTGDTIYLDRGRVGGRGAPVERPGPLHREPGVASRTRLRPARPLGRDRRRAVLRAYGRG